VDLSQCGTLRIRPTWKMQFTHRQIDGAFGKIEGPAVEVPPFGQAVPIVTPLGGAPVLPISATYSESGEAQIEASGTVGNAEGRVDDMRISGDNQDWGGNGHDGAGRRHTYGYEDARRPEAGRLYGKII
jgi:hypothetical protein